MPLVCYFCITEFVLEFLFRQEDQKFLGQDKMILSNTKMKEEIYLQFPSPLVNRRFSMPEELMRKYSIMREKTSDDSETIKTMDEITSTSSTFEETARRKLVKVQPAIDKSEALVDIKKVEAQGERKADACQQTMEESNLVLNQSKRVTQTDFYSKGEGIIRVREKLDTFTRTSDKATSTTLSAKEETDESGTTESVPSSSSPIQLPKHESLSDNLSSESDNVHCTCRELTSSKETSTDVFHSGKSTLSQTVSDKSFSTQDSTVSVKSVSTRGSTASDNSNTTTPEREKTSAKESTTSDYSPRSNMNRKNRRRERCLNEVHKKSCPKYHEAKHSRDNQYKRQGSAHFNPTGDEIDNRKSCGTITDFNMPKTQESITKTNNIINTLDIHLPDSVEKGEQESNLFTWAKLSQDELYMMQQLRHQKLLESRYSMSAMMPVTTPDSNDNDNRFFISSEGDETGNLEQSILIPRYSALPRTLSMLVNTSSADNSIMNSDSDNQSLADSLEDQPTNYVHKLYFDTKNESKPVRGAVHVVQETRQKDRTQKGRAFFVSFKDPFGEEKLPEGIEKIPQPPERIKNQILKRHLNLQKHTHIQQSKGEQKLSLQKKRTKSIKNENVEKVFSNKKTHKKEEKEDIYKKIGSKEQKKLVKRQEIDREKLKKREAEEKEHKKQIKSSENENEKKNEKSKKDFKEHKTRFVSKIPVLVSSRSTPSPERELEDIPKQSGSEEDFSKVMESTQILEIAQTSKGITLQKHQNFFSTPQKLIDNVRLEDKNYLSIPPLPSAVRMQSPFHPTLNRQALLSQTKRSPVSKYRQRFEVIPEEKSSSLSSAEEKTAIETLPKFTTTATSPLPTKNEKPSEVEVQSYKLTEIPEVFVAQIEDKQLRTLPFLKRNDEQKIILLSSQTENSNSSKGRDALIAMNCEDFKRLAKGWTNFYKLSENSENSDFEDKKGKENTKKNLKKHQKSLSNDGNSKVAKSDSNGNFLKDIANKRNGGPDEKSHHQAPQKEQQANSISEEMSKKKNSEIEDIDENIRLHSSNTILRTVKTISPSNSTKISTKKQISLPDLKAYPEKNIEPESQKSKSSIYPLPNVLPEISEDDTDTDSTDYMEPPSPRVPPLSLEGMFYKCPFPQSQNLITH